MTSIYTISHPSTLSVVYVGKSKNIELRFQKHLYNSHNSRLNKWVKSLQSDKIEPIFTIIDNCDDLQSNKVESDWIAFYKEQGCELFNGNRITIPTKTHQFQLSDDEFEKLYKLAELPKQVSKSVALRTVLGNYEEQIKNNEQLTQTLKKLAR